MTILLTGASGFMGGHVLHSLLQTGHKVIAPVRAASSAKINLTNADNLVLLQGDFYDGAVLKKALKEPVDAIIHLASVRGAGLGSDVLYHKVNVAGTKTLLDFAQQNNIKKFIYISSVGVLGTIPENPPAKPTDAPRPDGIYHKTKQQAEGLVQNAHNEKLQTLVIRPTITYGAGDDGFITKMIEMIKKGVFVYPRKPVQIHLLSVENFAKWLAAVVSQNKFDGSIYHCCDARRVELDDVVQVLAKRFTGEKYPSYKRLPASLFGTASLACSLFKKDGLKTSFDLISKDWFYDISGTEKQLHYTPVDTLEQLKKVQL